MMQNSDLLQQHVEHRRTSQLACAVAVLCTMVAVSLLAHDNHHIARYVYTVSVLKRYVRARQLLQ
jgi:predicted tellurium resistance membrane protein TerC